MLVPDLFTVADECRQNYRNRYWNEPYFRALEHIEGVAQKHGLTMAEIALRWISHHSLMKREFGDAVLIGASSLQHIEQVRLFVPWSYFVGVVGSVLTVGVVQNLIDLEKGPLREYLLVRFARAGVLGS